MAAGETGLDDVMSTSSPTPDGRPTRRAREPVVEDRGDGDSPTIEQADDDVAAAVLRDQETTTTDERDAQPPIRAQGDTP